jgi:hypothetical protein
MLSPAGRAPCGIACALATHQGKILRTVTGAYKATPTRLVELEAAVPPLDLYLNARAAAFWAKERPPGVTDLTNKLKRGIVARVRLR